MARDKTRDLRKGTRRNFLRKLSAMGVSGAALQYMTKDALAEVTDDPTEEVPRLGWLKSSGDNCERESIYYTIERDEWERTEALYQAVQKVNELLGSQSSKFWTGVTHETSGQNPKRAVAVNSAEVLIEDEVLQKSPPLENLSLPDTIDVEIGEGEYKTKVENIELSFDKYRIELNESSATTETSDDDYYTYRYRPLMGGIYAYSDAGEGAFTFATPASHPNYGNVIVTSSHSVGDGDGVTVYQNSTPNTVPEHEIGETVQHSNTTCDRFDAAIVDTDEEISYDVAQDSKNASFSEIDGIICEDRLKDLEAMGGHLWKQGTTTGRNFGDIERVGGFCRSYDFAIDADSDDGDSGRPYFEIDPIPDGVYIAGIHMGSSNLGNAVGCFVEEAEDRFNITVPGDTKGC